MKNFLMRDDYNYEGMLSPHLFLINRHETAYIKFSTFTTSTEKEKEEVLNALRAMFPSMTDISAYQYYAPFCFIKIAQASGYYDHNDRWINKLKGTYSVDIWYTDKFDSNIIEMLKKLCDNPEVTVKPKIHFIGINKHKEMYLKEGDLKLVSMDNTFYNTDFSLEKVEAIIKDTNKQGLLLFKGPPGTGKSYFIRYLSQISTDVKFVFIPQEQLRILTDPGFEEFAFDELKNCVIIIEDCETILSDRKNTKNPVVSSVLNLTDGMLGEALNIKIIATLNTADNIDTALLRKGRLLASVTFKELPAAQANTVSKYLGKNVIFNKDTSLAEIFNSEANSAEETKTSIGFSIGTLTS